MRSHPKVENSIINQTLLTCSDFQSDSIVTNALSTDTDRDVAIEETLNSEHRDSFVVEFQLFSQQYSGLTP